MASTGRKASSAGKKHSKKLSTPFPDTCPHMKPMLEDPIRTHALRQLVSTLSAFAIAKQRLVCASCPTGTPTDGRLHACLDCLSLNCWTTQHAQLHAHSTRHPFALEVARSALFCFHCNDYVYAAGLDEFLAPLYLLRNGSLHKKDFDRIGGEERAMLTELNTTPHPVASGILGLRGMHNLGNTCFMSSVLQSLIHNPLLRMYYLSDLHSARNCPISVAASVQGISEFMYPDGFGGVSLYPSAASSTTTQPNSNALSHHHQHHQHHQHQRGGGNPSSSSSSSSSSSTSSSSSSSSSSIASSAASSSSTATAMAIVGGGGGQRISVSGMLSTMETCMSCDLDTVFTNMFNGDIQPFIPQKFLFRLWKRSKQLAGYQQQDAHELFLSVCDFCHISEKEVLQTMHGIRIAEEIRCPCVIHRVFSGILRSEIVCKTCNQASLKKDPFFDISLDFPNTADDPSAPSSLPPAGGGGGVNLETLLTHFGRKEDLEETEAVKCDQCRDIRGSTKQLSFLSLPLTFALHLKRFVQTNPSARRNKNDVWSKVETHVDFPLYGFDPSVHLHPDGLRKDSLGNPVTHGHLVPGVLPIKDSWVYDLSSVIVHIGGMDSGHYVCYARHGNSWYLLDDDEVYLVKEEDVRRAQAYMLFYVRRSLSPEEAHHSPSVEELLREQEQKLQRNPPTMNQK